MINRKLTAILVNSLKNFPVVYLNGARQVGKSTLAQMLASAQWPAEYITFDDATMLGAVEASPESFLKAFEKNVVLDEVQLADNLFRVLKKLVDESRFKNKKDQQPTYLLTGSANILALPKLSDALVGRMNVLTLYPLSALEISQGKGNFLSQLTNASFKIKTIKRTTSLTKIIQAATFPEISESNGLARRQWFESYMTTIMQRDVRQIAYIAKLGVLPNLLKILASRAGGLINEADIGRAIRQNAVTSKNYRVLLQMMFLTFEIPPWFRNIGKRLVKSAKGYIMDTSLLCHLLSVDLEKVEKTDPHVFGHIFENFIASELLKLISFSDQKMKLFHYRTSDGKEVDFVLEQANGKLVAIEVKAKEILTQRDFNELKEFKSQVTSDFICGIVLYRGSQIVPFGDDLWAIPVDLIWQ